MTLNEFKAWLEGYEESFDDSKPNINQWNKIKEKLAETNAIKSDKLFPGVSYGPSINN